MNPMDFLPEFQEEALEKLDVIASQLLRLEKDPSNLQPVREMFLAAHTVKGGAAMLRLTDVEGLAHALEDLLSSVRDQHRTLDGATADLLFQTLDQLRALITAASASAVGAEADPRVEAFAVQLRTAASSAPAATSVAVAPAEIHAPKRALVVEPSATARALHRLLLEEQGYDVVACASAAEADAGAFALVVASFQEGLLLGPQVRPERVVLVTANVTPARTQQALDAGASALIERRGYDDDDDAAFAA